MSADGRCSWPQLHQTMVPLSRIPGEAKADSWYYMGLLSAHYFLSATRLLSSCVLHALSASRFIFIGLRTCHLGVAPPRRRFSGSRANTAQARGTDRRLP
jgi:hypothetical protein